MRELKRYEEIEKSLITKYRKDIYAKVIRAVSDYSLINETDNVMVCISGGKDSFIMAKCLEELSKHGKFSFNLHFVVMDPGYSKANRDLIEKNAKTLNIPIEIFDSNIFDVVTSISEDSPCYLCARMRRGFLYKHAQDLGCNKIALGHHFDDVIETNLLSMFYAAEIKTMLPKLHSQNFEGIELIRPMYYVKEKDIIAWAKYNNLKFLNCACKYTEEHYTVDDGKSKRKEIKELIKKLKEVNPTIDDNIFKAYDNININCVLGYLDNGEKHSFLDDYDK